VANIIAKTDFNVGSSGGNPLPTIRQQMAVHQDQTKMFSILVLARSRKALGNPTELEEPIINIEQTITYNDK
jgi:hypothetical protein